MKLYSLLIYNKAIGTLLNIMVQRIQFIGYISLTYHTNLPSTLNRVHYF